MKRVGIGCVVVVLLAACGPRGGGGTSTRPSNQGTAGAPKADPEQAFAVLKRLQTALAARSAGPLAEIGHPQDGIWFWTQPGAYPRPTSHFTGTQATLPDELELEALARALERGLPVAGVDRPPYALPPEEELQDAPPWASLRTQNVTFTAADWPALDEEPQVRAAALRATFQYELEIELGYEAVFVYLVEDRGILYVAHVISFTHYSA